MVLSFDEKGKTAVKVYGGMKWTKNAYYHVPYKQKVVRLFDLFAARNLHDGNVHHRFYLWKNSFVVIDFYEHMLALYPDKDIYVIRDGWSAHKSATIQIFLDTHPRLHDVPLPTCASWMNAIERDFSRIDNEVLKNSCFASAGEAQDMVAGFIEDELCHNGHGRRNRYRNL